MLANALVILVSGSYLLHQLDELSLDDTFPLRSYGVGPYELKRHRSKVALTRGWPCECITIEVRCRVVIARVPAQHGVVAVDTHPLGVEGVVVDVIRIDVPHDACVCVCAYVCARVREVRDI